MTLGSPLVSPGFAGCHGPADRRQYTPWRAEPASNETIRKCWRSRFLVLRKTPETAVKQSDVDLNEEVAMNAIVADVLAREAAKAQSEPHPLTLITLFCGVGLVAALTMALMGFDLGAGLF
jgi:hypothetical protein